MVDACASSVEDATWTLASVSCSQDVMSNCIKALSLS